MKISPYGLIALTMLVIGAPALVFAETENEANEGANEISEKQSASTTGEEHEGNDDKSISSANSNVILFVTIAAIASVVGYSAWKVFKIRKRAASKTLV